MEEVWKDIKGFDGRYQVSNFGKVKSFARKNPRILKPGIDKDGYHKYSLSTNKMFFNKMGHRLVAEAFLPNPQDLQVVNHKNMVKDDNSVGNLEWCDVGHNTRHGFRNNKTHKTLSSLTKDDFSEAVDLYLSGYTYKQLNDHFDVVCRDDYWGEVFRGRKFSKFSGITTDIRRKNTEDRADCLHMDSLILSILDDFYVKGLKQSEIVRNTQLNCPYIHSVVKGKTRRYIYDRFMEEKCLI